MSEESAVDAEDDDSSSREMAIENVPRPRTHGDRLFEMDVIGWIIFLLIIVLLIPLLPALIIVNVLARLFGWRRDQRLSWG